MSIEFLPPDARRAGKVKITQFKPPSGSRNNGAADRGDGANPRIELLAFDEMKLNTERRHLVKGLMPRVGLCVVWGPPKCGKSFWVFDLAMHVALDRPYRGRRVQGGAVVYCAFEGAHGFSARAEGFRQQFLPDYTQPVPFFVESVTLDLVRDHAALIRAIIKAKLPNGNPAPIVLYTLNQLAQRLREQR